MTPGLTEQAVADPRSYVREYIVAMRDPERIERGEPEAAVDCVNVLRGRRRTRGIRERLVAVSSPDRQDLRGSRVPI